MLRAAENKDEHTASFITTPLYLPCLLGTPRKDDEAEVSWVKQDTTSFHYVFLLKSKLLPLYISKAGLGFVIMTIVVQLFSRLQCNASPYIHTYSHTHIPLRLEWKKSNKHMTLSQQFSHNMMGSVKRKIHFE